MKRKSIVTAMLLACMMFFATREAQAFYNPSTGRWLSRDPIKERGGPNLYGMVRNDMIDRRDYLGLEETPNKSPEPLPPPRGPGKCKQGCIFQ